MKSKSIILTSVGCVLSTSLGVGIGYILSTFFPHITKSIDYGAFDPLVLKADGDACLSKFDKAKKSSAFDGKTLEGWEIVNAALRRFELEERNMSQGIGRASAKIGPMNVDQQIRSTMFRVGDRYFEESLSKSFAVNVAWRIYQEGSETKRYKGSCPDNVEQPSFAENVQPTVYSEAEYLEHAGRNLDGSACIYLISDKTLASPSQASLSSLPMNQIKKNGDGTYDIDLELDARKSVVNYVKQMKATTDINGYPTFEYVHATFTVTENAELVKSTFKERYYASTPSGSSNLDGTLTTYYSTGGNYAIPELNDYVTYDHR